MAMYVVGVCCVIPISEWTLTLLPRELRCEYALLSQCYAVHIHLLFRSARTAKYICPSTEAPQSFALQSCNHSTMTAEDFANVFMTEVFKHHGLPEEIISDRGTIFRGFFAEVCKQLGIKQAMSTAFHPQTDGQTERTNRTLEEMLRHYISPSQDDWDLKLSCAEFAVNNAVKAATSFSPFYLNHGRHPRAPSSIVVDTQLPSAHEFAEKLNVAISRARDCLAAAQAHMKRNADSHRRDAQLAVGDEVLLS